MNAQELMDRAAELRTHATELESKAEDIRRAEALRAQARDLMAQADQLDAPPADGIAVIVCAEPPPATVDGTEASSPPVTAGVPRRPAMPPLAARR